MLIYKTILGPKDIHVPHNNRNSATKVIDDIINEQAKQGWSYHSMETIFIIEPPGCVLALFSPPQRIETFILIFCRDDGQGSIGTTATAPIATAPIVAAPSVSASVAPASATPAAAPAPAAAGTTTYDTWTCSKCGTVNKSAYAQCKKCASYRSST